MAHIIFLIFTFFLLLESTYSQTHISHLEPANVIGGIGQILTITGEGFGKEQDTNFISFLNDDFSFMSPMESRSLKYFSWSDSKIELEMPCAYSGKIKINIAGIDYNSDDSIRVKACLAYLNVNPLDYIYLSNRNKIGGYTWHIHRTYWENSEAKEAIEDVFRELRCKTGVNYNLAHEASDNSIDLSDSINLIAPDPSIGAVGYCSLLWSSCTVGQETLYERQTMDISMSVNQDWYFGKGKVPSGKAKFRYVLLHELCHSLGLGHVNELGQTMYPSVTLLPADNWNDRDTITIEEQLAISYLVKLSQEFTFRDCGITPINTISNCEEVYPISSSFTNNNTIEKLNVFPNPAGEMIYISNYDGFYEILDLFGRSLLSGYANGGSINIGLLQQGFYMINLDGSKVKLMVE